MKKNILYSWLLLLTIASSAQSQKGEADVSLFPKISLIWNEYDPIIKMQSEFILKENENNIDFTIENLNDSIPKKNRTILFLWEDMNHISHKGEFDFTRQMLFDFFKDGDFSDGDRFNIATFRRKGENNQALNYFLNDQFTSNTDQLRKVVDNYTPSYDNFSNFSSSDIYRAIDEGIEILKKEPAENIRMLVVISYGISCSKAIGGKNDTDDSRIEAIKSRIPVTLIEYNSTSTSRFSSRIVTGTYGTHILTSDPLIANQKLFSYLNEVDRRHHGQDYKLTFTTTQKRDGKSHSIILKVNGAENTLTFVSPSFSILVWSKENKLASMLIAIGTILFLGLIIFITVKLNQKHKIKRKNEILQIENEQVELKKQIEQKENIIREETARNKQEMINYQKMVEQEKIEQQQQVKETELRKLMRTKNMFPRLQCVVKENSFIYQIKDVSTSIGRTANNDVVLNHNTVSKQHAIIEFNGVDFDIVDCESTNKVIVNGQFTKVQTLKNGDIIGLGEAVITFYL